MKKAFFRTNNGSIMFDSKSAKNKYSECSRKQKLTNSVANLIIKKTCIKTGKLLYTYLCPHCRMWHLTHIKQ